jgi:putative transposase
MILVLGVWAFVRALLGSSAAVTLENVALRHQLAVLQRSVGRPRLRRWDRLVWVGLSQLWAGWRSTLVIVQPATVLAWHRQGFQLYWRWKSRRRSASRPPLDLELCTPIRRMARENPTWGRRRIQAELRFLGYEVAELTVAKYMRRLSPRPSATWRAFLEAHIRDIVAVDFFVVPTLTFRLLFGFLILRHHRRELVHVNVTDHPTAAWATHQLVESFPEETAPKFLLRDRDAIYGNVFVRQVNGLGMSEILIAPRAPWQNPFAERAIGSIRRECLDHVIVINKRHLRRLLRSYLAYYNTTRPHQSLHNQSPHPRKVQPRADQHIVAIPQVGGLHHRWTPTHQLLLATYESAGDRLGERARLGKSNSGRCRTAGRWMMPARGRRLVCAADRVGNRSLYARLVRHRPNRATAHNCVRRASQTPSPRPDVVRHESVARWPPRVYS